MTGKRARWRDSVRSHFACLGIGLPAVGYCAPVIESLSPDHTPRLAAAAITATMLLVLIAVLWAYHHQRLRGRSHLSSPTYPDSSLVDAYIELDIQGRCHGFHPVAPDAGRWLASMGGLIGKTIDEVLPTEAALVCHSLLHEAQLFGRSAARRIAFPTAKEARWFEVSAAKTTTRNGWRPARRFILQSRDVTTLVREAKIADQTSLTLNEVNEALLTATAAAFLITDANGRCISFDISAERLTGYQAHELVGENVLALFLRPSPSTHRVKQAIRRALLQHLQSGDGVRPELHPIGRFTLTRKDGQQVTIDLAIRPLRSNQNGDWTYLAIASDRTVQTGIEDKWRLAASIIAEAREAIVVADPSATIISANPAFARITGFSVEEAIGQSLLALKILGHDPTQQADIWSTAKNQGRWHGEISATRKNGGSYPQRTSLIRATSPANDATHFLLSFSDISDYRDAETAIRKLAYYDLLTGLPNRALLADRMDYLLSRARRGNEPLSLMFLDLDRFKNINDALGHHIGDELLIQLANRLRSVLREEDIVSRLGGDEFILVFANTPADGAIRIAEKLLRVIEARYQIGQHELSCTASIGIAVYPRDGDSLETLSMSADTAMYRAKKQGKNAYCFFLNDMQVLSARTLIIENELRRAIEGEQFSLHYQPQLSLHTQRIVGAEALLRWNHPTLGQVSPGEFIPIAEESGLIQPIGDWALRTAAHQMHQWIAQGLPAMTVSVNLSALQFRHPDLIARVSSILREEALPANALELELTESATMDDPLRAISVIRQLRDHGVQMAIDDFGTGYSSMNHLKRFSASRLKIDQSFIRNVLNNAEDAAIIAAIIGLAHNLDMRTIAEGVESVEQLQFLEQQGCDEIQGFLFARPMPAADFERLVTSHDSSRWLAQRASD